jgi:antitoxin MazE
MSVAAVPIECPNELAGDQHASDGGSRPNRSSKLTIWMADRISLEYLSRVRNAMSQVTVGRWGKNLAVRLPGEIVRRTGLRDGEHVEIEARNGDIIIRRTIPRFALEELFHGKSPEDWRAAYAGAFDWGSDVGREIIEE